MKVLTLNFDEYGELIGSSVLKCGEEYSKEKEEFLEECDGGDEYDELVMMDDGWVMNYGWGNYEVCIEFEEEKFVYVEINEESELVEYDKSDERKVGEWWKWGEGVFVGEEDEEEMSIEGSRRKNSIMIVVDELENVNIREC